MADPETWRPIREQLRWPNRLTPLLHLGDRLVRPEDDDDTAFRKRVGTVLILVGSVIPVISAAVLYMGGQVVVSGFLLALFLGDAVVVVTLFVARPDLYPWVIRLMLLGNLVVANVITAWHGGFVASAANPLWGVMAPFTTGTLIRPREGSLWFAAWAILTALSIVLDPLAGAVTMGGPSGLAMNVLWSMTVLFAGVMIFEVRRRSTAAALQKQRQRMDDLLRNVLPESIVEHLTETGPPPPRRFDDVSIGFIDLVGFTPLAASLPPEEVVALLDDLFKELDALVVRHGLEKIKTIGDAYMVAGGVPEPRPDHLADLARFALDARALIADRDGLDARIGLHAGPAVAGIIGEKRFAYDLWGDTVNTASRMESSGEPGTIQCTADVVARLEDFVTEPRGTIDVKGKGPTRVHRLVSAGAHG